jgi:hypothetical protein
VSRRFRESRKQVHTFYRKMNVHTTVDLGDVSCWVIIGAFISIIIMHRAMHDYRKGQI